MIQDFSDPFCIQKCITIQKNCSMHNAPKQQCSSSTIVSANGEDQKSEHYGALTISHQLNIRFILQYFECFINFCLKPLPLHFSKFQLYHDPMLMLDDDVLIQHIYYFVSTQKLKEKNLINPRKKERKKKQRFMPISKKFEKGIRNFPILTAA